MPTLSLDGLCHHESDPPLRERKRSENRLLTQAPSSGGSGVRAEQAELVPRGPPAHTERSPVHGEAEVQRERARDSEPGQETFST